MDGVDRSRGARGGVLAQWAGGRGAPPGPKHSIQRGVHYRLPLLFVVVPEWLGEWKETHCDFTHRLVSFRRRHLLGCWRDTENP